MILFGIMQRCVRFAHSSVKQFFLSNRDDRDLRYPDNEAQGNLGCGEFCVAYLSFSDFSLQIVKQEHDRTSSGSAVLMPALLAGDALKSSLVSLFRAPRNQKVSVNLPIRPVRRGPPGAQYRFLNYAVSNWGLQTRDIRPDSPVWGDFTQFATCFNEAWNIHPWVSGGRSRHSFIHGLFGWVVKEQHNPLLSIVTRMNMTL
ncbi:uncharacterized protein BO97DRAFT_185648 [Aspergillus homomorphus CBS 101889]|uniref:Uncharacterized protein n=1 Tax=Aspergillus homomorphus (strain CBS 101889) TaxID=1450537 RepID=A0A395HML0_ASPHC|nr:hypothetical protein BO97DRAFT_185648 [Aspergillus homomorphus CBS 101889]RAL09172.1 hypothetical protein BO97DRAFT_185648 [Aspergillus homomorphus CBS 101889]